MYILSCNVTIAVGHLTNLLSDTPDEWKTDNGGKNVSPFPLVLFLLMCVSALVRVKSKQVLLCDMSENQKRLERYIEVLSNSCRCAEKPESRGWWDIVSLCPGIWATSEHCSARSSKFISESLNYPHTQHVSLYGSKYGVSNENEKLSMEICRDRQQPVNSVTWFSCKIKLQSLEEKTTWKIFT